MKKVLLALIVGVLFLASGCASTKVGTDFGSVEKIQTELVKGQTTKQEVLALYGKPQSKIANSDGTETFVYTFVKSDTSVNAATYIPVVGLFAGGAETQMNMNSLSITFIDSVVSNYTYSTSQHNGEYSTLGGYKGN